jgi:hypothetical protein
MSFIGGKADMPPIAPIGRKKIITTDMAKFGLPLNRLMVEHVLRIKSPEALLRKNHLSR